MQALELSIEEQIIVAVRQITHAVDLWSRQLWQQVGLTSPQLAVLREIRSGRNVTPTTIADALHLTQPTVTGVLQRLERVGAVRRERSLIDRRSVHAIITPKGESLAANSPSLLRDRVRKRLTQLPKTKRARLLEDVRLLAEMIDAPAPNGAPFLYSGGAPAANGDHNRRTRGRNARRREEA
jgi:DNA-binding MarR family transcriptional regulator